jgi:RNA polymerase sigma-70 factor (ECF subfamily)
VEGQWEEARRRCVHIAQRYTRDPYEAEDIAQEALIRAWRHSAGLRESERRWNWLARIVRNEALRERGRAHPEPIADPERNGNLAAAETAPEEGGDLEQALAQLTREERVLIRLRYADDLTQRSIARLLEIPEGTVKVRLHRARAKLRRALPPNGNDRQP